MKNRKPEQFDKPRCFRLNLHLKNDANLGRTNSLSLHHLSKSESVQYKQAHFPSNFIRTTKYTPWSFVPKSIMAQFNRYANVYFLIVAVLQCFREISEMNPFNAIAPLVLVLSLCMLRDGFEEYRRYKSDKITNNFDCQQLRNGVPTTIKWKDVQVGDVLIVKNDEKLPADLILLSSSEDGGLCFLETSNLDGEKNLKTKKALKVTYDCVANSSNLSAISKWEFFAGKPSSNIYYFEGHLNVVEDDKIEQRIIFNEKQLILRGAKLRNTRWIIGAVAYSGRDCRIMRNSGFRRKQKQSNIERKANEFIILILFFQIISSIGCSLIYFSFSKSRVYFFNLLRNFKLEIGLETFIIFLTYFQLTNTMIPISLIVSLELVKLSQAYFINQDEEMYVPENDKYCKVMSSSLNEELGQIQYLFTDKTGTLTCNQMEFKLLVAGNVLFGEQYLHQDASPASPSRRMAENNEPAQIEDQSPSKSKWKKRASSVFFDKGHNFELNFYDKKLKSILRTIAENSKKKSASAFFNGLEHASSFTAEGSLSNGFSPLAFTEKKTGDTVFQIPSLHLLIQEILIIISTCHECVFERDPVTHYIKYLGSSADEIALVDAARHLGFRFIGSSRTSITVEIFETRRYFELLHTFPFDSYRKRMSIIVRDNGIIKLYMKGADNVVSALLDPKVEQVYKKNVDEYVYEMSKKGFRSLYIAMKVISEEEWESYQRDFESLIGKGDDTEAENRKLADVIEKDLLLLGAVGVEDKLQDRVPDTIKAFIKASKKNFQRDEQIWMLTGDKMETAENIGISSKLIQPYMSSLRISYELINDGMSMMKIFEEIWSKYQELQIANKRAALIVDGTSLAVLLSDSNLNKRFLELCQYCDSVICCRVTPGQKAEVVRQIKTKFKKITLAVGDGANDVAMIQEANIGVGIFGQEGNRAAQASDYAIGEFRCLWKLLLVHGRWSYLRVSKMILYFLYKNMMISFPQILFCIFSFGSGQSLFDDWYISCYNLIFTALPLAVRAVLDYDVYYRYINSKLEWSIRRQGIFVYFSFSRWQEVSERPIIRKNYPLLYEVSQQNQIFTYKSFFFWMSQSLLHSGYIFFINYFLFDFGTLGEGGQTADLWALSISTFTSILLAVDAKLALETQSWSLIMISSIVFTSLAVYFAFIFFIDQLPNLFLYKTADMLLSSFHFYASFILCVGALIALDYIQIIFAKEISASKADIFQRLIKIGKDDDVDLLREMVHKKKKKKGIIEIKPIPIKIKAINS